ncbi:MAG: polymer-forming cytoskeletal protein [Deltaproteobacteria bacterium]|nr:polymer-forming cytoskeletal protein [Deltaproteobacteria bacterium]
MRPNKEEKRLEQQMGPDVNVVTEDTVLKGNIKTKDSILMSGKLEGDVDCDKMIWVSKSGRVDGMIQAMGAIVEGEINGNIKLVNQLELRSTGRIIGDIISAKIGMAEGCFYEGEMKTTSAKEKPTTFVEKRKS